MTVKLDDQPGWVVVRLIDGRPQLLAASRISQDRGAMLRDAARWNRVAGDRGHHVVAAVVPDCVDPDPEPVGYVVVESGGYATALTAQWQVLPLAAAIERAAYLRQGSTLDGYEARVCALVPVEPPEAIDDTAPTTAPASTLPAERGQVRGDGCAETQGAIQGAEWRSPDGWTVAGAAVALLDSTRRALGQLTGGELLSLTEAYSAILGELQREVLRRNTEQAGEADHG